MDLPNRKPHRLKNYDYSQPNAYFVTICTENRKNMLWKNVGASIARLYDFYGNSPDERSSYKENRTLHLAKIIP